MAKRAAHGREDIRIGVGSTALSEECLTDGRHSELPRRPGDAMFPSCGSEAAGPKEGDGHVGIWSEDTISVSDTWLLDATGFGIRPLESIAAGRDKTLPQSRRLSERD